MKERKEHKNRLALMKAMPRNSVGVEVGVCIGEFAEEIFKTNPPRIFYGVDHWDAPINPETDSAFRKEQRERLWRTMHRFSKRIMTGQYRPLCMKSVDAAKLFETGMLDWVYIDAHHSYGAVSEDLTAWYPKVKSGGIVAGHDWNKPCIRKAVWRFVRARHIKGLASTCEPYGPGHMNPRSPRNPIHPQSFWFVKP